MLSSSSNERLREVHHVVVVRVRLVQLDRRELRVVPRRDAFIAPDATQLKDALEAAHHEALEVQLRAPFRRRAQKRERERKGQDDDEVRC